jgi:hypothetical protein
MRKGEEINELKLMDFEKTMRVEFLRLGTNSEELGKLMAPI